MEQGNALPARIANRIIAPRPTCLLTPSSDNTPTVFTSDGKNKYASDVLLLIWNAFKDNKIEIPSRHRVIGMKGLCPT